MTTQENREEIKAALRNSLATALQITVDQVRIVLDQDNGSDRRLSSHSTLRVSYEVVLSKDSEESTDSKRTAADAPMTEPASASVLNQIQSMQNDPTPFLQELRTELVDRNVAPPSELGASVSKPEVQRRTVQFFTSPWSPCTLCMNGTPPLRVREVWCADVDVPVKKVDAVLCEELEQPKKEEPCPAEERTPRCGWSTSAWSPCIAPDSSSCEAGRGVQHRTVKCLSIDEKGNCIQNGPRPSEHQTCSLTAVDCNSLRSSGIESDRDDAREDLVRPLAGSAHDKSHSTGQDTTVDPDDSDGSSIVIPICIVCIILFAGGACRSMYVIKKQTADASKPAKIGTSTSTITLGADSSPTWSPFSFKKLGTSYFRKVACASLELTSKRAVQDNLDLESPEHVGKCAVEDDLATTSGGSTTSSRSENSSTPPALPRPILVRRPSTVSSRPAGAIFPPSNHEKFIAASRPIEIEHPNTASHPTDSSSMKHSVAEERNKQAPEEAAKRTAAEVAKRQATNIEAMDQVQEEAQTAAEASAMWAAEETYRQAINRSNLIKGVSKTNTAEKAEVKPKAADATAVRKASEEEAKYIAAKPETGPELASKAKRTAAEENVKLKAAGAQVASKAEEAVQRKAEEEGVKRVQAVMVAREGMRRNVNPVRRARVQSQRPRTGNIIEE